MELFMLPSTLAAKNVSLDLGYFKHFRSKHFELLANRSLFVEVIRQLSWFAANNASDMSEISLEIRSSCTAIFCKNGIFYFIRKNLRWSPFLVKLSVTPQVCNCTEKDTIIDVFMWMYLCEHIFSFFIFLFQKRSMYLLNSQSYFTS